MNPGSELVWLHHAGQHLALVPGFGGGVACWQVDAPGLPGRRTDLWRPWDGSHDAYRLASFAMLPWSNRIGAGGFEQDGRFHPMRPNRAGEPYPIHGDGWLQAWDWTRPAPGTVELQLLSHRHGGNPYRYAAWQRFTLLPGGLDQQVEVQHLGDEPLPYGLGLHPWFPRPPGTRLQAGVDGVWLAGADPMPTGHTATLPPDWDLPQGIGGHGSFIDNAFSGWSGRARIDWPSLGLRLTAEAPVTGPDAVGYCLVYRPAEGPAFCFEPITQPIDAFHLPGRPGLRVLARGERLRLRVAWRFEWSAEP